MVVNSINYFCIPTLYIVLLKNLTKRNTLSKHIWSKYDVSHLTLADVRQNQPHFVQDAKSFNTPLVFVHYFQTVNPSSFLCCTANIVCVILIPVEVSV